MDAVVMRQGRRRGRWLVLALLSLGLVALIVGIVELSTQGPERGKAKIEGIGEAQQIFGGVRQEGDRLGSPDAPVSIQVFDDLQCSSCRRQFLTTIPPLVEDYVRPGDVMLEYRHYSFSPLVAELGFLGAEAAADQGYSWPYIYLFFRNQAEAERLGIDEDFLATIAGSILELDVPEWRDYLDAEGGPGGQIRERLERYERLGSELGIRAEPAFIVSGPAGTRTLQDAPALNEITAAIDAVG
jgi:protein-disulfide isomerase